MAKQLFVASDSEVCPDTSWDFDVCSSFGKAADVAGQFIDDNIAEEEAYVYELVLVGKVRRGKPVVEKIG